MFFRIFVLDNKKLFSKLSKAIITMRPNSLIKGETKIEDETKTKKNIFSEYHYGRIKFIHSKLMAVEPGPSKLLS